MLVVSAASATEVGNDLLITGTSGVVSAAADTLAVAPQTEVVATPSQVRDDHPLSHHRRVFFP